MSEVKPGVMVNVCKPAPKTESSRHGGEKDPPKTPKMTDATAETLHAFLEECATKLEALENQVTALDTHVELLNGQLELSRERSRHDHAERTALLAAKSSLETQVSYVCAMHTVCVDAMHPLMRRC